MRRWWLLCFAAYLLLCAAWAVALPANGSYDEKDHIVRAYAVAGGHLTARRTAIDRRGDRNPAFAVPASLLPPPSNVDCTWSPRPARAADCQHWRTGRQPVLYPTGAARYSPVYYLAVGLPLRLSPDLTGIILARLLSALWSALLLSGAVIAALRAGRRLLALGVALVATPMALSLAGAVNPNGLEIAAGILVLCSALALLRAPRTGLDDRSVRGLLAMAGTGSLILLTVRQIGPALLALDLLAVALIAGPGSLGPATLRQALAALWRRRDARWILGGSWSLGLAFAAAWLGYSGLADVAPNTRDAQHLGLAPELWYLLTDRVPFEVRQLIGQFGYGEVYAPRLTVPVWYLLIAALAVPAAIAAGRRVVLAAGGLAILGFGLLAVMDLYFVPRIGWFSQGRYVMASLVGVVLLPMGSGPFEQWLAGRGWLRRCTVVAAALVGALHLAMLSGVITRFQAGLAAPLDPFGGAWHPPVGSLTPLLLAFGGAVLLGIVLVFARVGAAQTPAEAGPPQTPAEAGPRRIRPPRWVAVGLIDQVVIAVANAANNLLALALLSRSRAGVMLLSLGVGYLVIGINRAFVGEVLLTLASRYEGERHIRLVRNGISATLALSGIATAVLLLLWLGLPVRGGIDLRDLVWVAPFLPSLLLHDTARYSYLAARRPQRALVIDAVWVGTQLAGVLLLYALGRVSAGGLFVCWGLGATAGASVFAWRTRILPWTGSPRHWLRETRHLSGWFTATALIGQFQGQAVGFLVASRLSTRELSGLRGAQTALLQPAQNFITAVMGLLVPRASRLAAAAATPDAPGRLAAGRLHSQTLRLAAGFAVLGAVMVAVVVPVARTVLVRLPKFADIAPLALPIALQPAIYLVQLPFAAAIRGMHRPALLFAQYVVFTTVSLSGLVVGTYLGRLPGAAWGLTIGSAVGLSAMVGLYWPARRRLATTAGPAEVSAATVDTPAVPLPGLAGPPPAAPRTTTAGTPRRPPAVSTARRWCRPASSPRWRSSASRPPPRE